MRAALPLSRLEIRYRRQLSRSAERAAANAIRGQGEAARLSLHRAQRHRHDLYGAAGEEAAAARIRMAHRAGEPCLHLETLSGLPLAAGNGGRYRFITSRLSPRNGGDEEGDRA